MFSHHFSINNIPFGIASSVEHPQKSVATRFEDTLIFLDELAKESPQISRDTIRTFSSVSKHLNSLYFASTYVHQETLNAFAALPKSEQTATRKWIQSHLVQPSSLPTTATAVLSRTTLHLPLQIGDFTDFSCSRDHVLNAGEAVFQKRELPPGFEYFPIGYHGRSSTVVVSGTPIVRPKGQYRDEKGGVGFGPTKKLDYELEIAAVIGKSSRLGETVGIEHANEYIFGLVLLNDWSGELLIFYTLPICSQRKHGGEVVADKQQLAISRAWR
jgi:fumarylacetoacetase